MTYEEAIKIINEGVETGNCPTNLCHYSETGCGDCKWRIALYKAIEAIEKQIPKKVEKVEVQPYFRKHYPKNFICPKCHSRVGEKVKYCSECGQRLE